MRSKSRNSSFYVKMFASRDENLEKEVNQLSLQDSTKDPAKQHRPSFFARAKHILARSSIESTSSIDTRSDISNDYPIYGARPIYRKSRSRASYTDAVQTSSTTKVNPLLLSTRSNVTSVKIPQPIVSMYTPQVWAFLGRFDELRGLLMEDKSLLNSSFDWLQDNKIVNVETIPPHIPHLVRAALYNGLECQRVTPEERYILTKYFSGSSLLHFACAGNQYTVVKYLLEIGADTMKLNNGGKEPEFYTTDDNVFKLFWPEKESQPAIKSERTKVEGSKTKSNDGKADRSSQKVRKKSLQNANDLPPPAPPMTVPPSPSPPKKSKSPFVTLNEPQQSISNKLAISDGLRSLSPMNTPNFNSSPKIIQSNQANSSPESSDLTRHKKSLKRSISKDSLVSNVPVSSSPLMIETQNQYKVNDDKNKISVSSSEYYSHDRGVEEEKDWSHPPQTGRDNRAAKLKERIAAKSNRMTKQSNFIGKLNGLKNMTQLLDEMAKEDLTHHRKGSPTDYRGSPVIVDSENNKKSTARLHATVKKALLDPHAAVSGPGVVHAIRRGSVIKSEKEIQESLMQMIASIPKTTRNEPLQISHIKRDAFDPPEDPVHRTSTGYLFNTQVGSHGEDSNQASSSSSSSIIPFKSHVSSIFGGVQVDEESNHVDKETLLRVSRRGSFFQLYESMAELLYAPNKQKSSAIANPHAKDDMDRFSTDSEDSEDVRDIPVIKQIFENDNHSIASSYAEPWHMRLNRQVPRHQAKTRERFLRSRSVDSYRSSSNRYKAKKSRELIWSRAAGASIDDRIRGDIEIMKDEALEEGYEMLRTEFKSYAQKDPWEALLEKSKRPDVKGVRKRMVKKALLTSRF